MFSDTPWVKVEYSTNLLSEFQGLDLVSRCLFLSMSAISTDEGIQPNHQIPSTQNDQAKNENGNHVVRKYARGIETEDCMTNHLDMHGQSKQYARQNTT